MQDNFNSSLTLVLQSEGGFVNNPADPGGATNKGITQRVYDNWRQSFGEPVQSVSLITDNEVSAIYKKLYWDKIWGDQLPSGIDYAVFDFAVNSGVSRAIHYLQRALGVESDGQMGPVTITAADNADSQTIINQLCGLRQAFLEGLPTFGTFGKGWTSRISSVGSNAAGMVT